MATRLLIIPASLVATLFPALSTLSGQEQHETSRAFVARSLKFLLLVMGPLVVILVVYARQILESWLGPEYARRSAAPLQILAIGVLANSLAYAPYALLQARGRPDLTAKFHLLELPVHLLVLGTLIQIWGLVGAAVAWSVRVTLDAALLYLAAHRLSGISVASLVAAKVPQALALLAALGALAAIDAAVVATPWVRLSILAVILVSSGAMTWHCFLDERDRTHVFALLWPAGNR
jgi:O-antigen/teichoic acid export membrane protein